MINASPVRSPANDVWAHVIDITGAGAANPTKNHGAGVTVTWVSTGLYELAWSENPQTYLTYTHGFRATTASALKGFTVTAGDYNATTFKMRFSVTNASDNLADLAAAQSLGLVVYFREAGSTTGSA
jgi:hypothetical protein